MSPERTTESWAEIRHKYEHSDQPIEVICAEHGISPGTLRDRMRRWRWTRRRPPIPRDGPPPSAPQRIGATFAMWTPTPTLPLSGGGSGEAASGGWRNEAVPPASIWDCDGDAPVALIAPDDLPLPSPHIVAGGETAAPSAPDEEAIVPRLQGAVARVLPAIETMLGRLGSGPMPPRELEQTARALGALTRTLRELNGLLGQRLAEEPPVDVEALRENLAQKLIALLDEPDPEDGDGGDRNGDVDRTGDGETESGTSTVPMAAPAPVAGEGTTTSASAGAMTAKNT